MERLRQLREAKGMTQVRLGIELNVSQETISGYETGKAAPPAESLIRLADVLEASVDYILGRTDIKALVRTSELTLQETELLTTFRKLSSSKKERVIGFIQGLID